jgi:hypothetical protein
LRPVTRRMRDELFPITIPKRLHLSKDENAKTARICVNARTGKCAPHKVERPLRGLTSSKDGSIHVAY